MCAVAVIPRWLSGSHSYKRVGREGERERIGKEGKWGGGERGNGGYVFFFPPLNPPPAFPQTPRSSSSFFCPATPQFGEGM